MTKADLVDKIHANIGPTKDEALDPDNRTQSNP